MALLRIGISAGDPNGIGPEVLMRALATWSDADAQVTVYGPGQVLRAEAAHWGASAVELREVAAEFAAQPGRPDRTAGAVALAALRAAVADARAGALDALVTLPIDKATTHGPDFPFAGHTEYLAQQFAGRALMLMVHGGLRVGLVTTHVPLAQVSAYVTRARVLDRIRQMAQSLRIDFGIEQPRIALLGLNPHAGDGGLLGAEEQNEISPAIADATAEGIRAEGPFAADGFFQFGAYRGYDGVLAMYHDQGLVPFKALAAGGGVNFTAGLSVVRTSPDHGTAYDIVGKGVADHRSTREALELAVQIAQQRRKLAL